MRITHRDNCLHQIEYWTGNFFRPAQLWEVGSYVLIPHCSGETTCETLVMHTQFLEKFQKPKDDAEKTPDLHPREEATPTFGDWETFANDRNDEDEHMDVDIGEGVFTVRDDTGGQDVETAAEAKNVPVEQDRLHHLHGFGFGLANETADIDQMFGEDDMVDDVGVAAAAAAEKDVPVPTAGDIPRRDGLDNPYVRIVHTNGIHYIPLVICRCRGIANRNMDLMYAKFIPTSFARYRTLFTSAVLDDFRLSNLECKASAFQYWQKLSRMTSAATSSSEVDNFVRELRRLSRCWRWLKKLKWAGFGHKDCALMDSSPGELAIFCPACPQPGINLPRNWQDDVNQ